MTHEEIMKKIASGLSGDSAADVKYLAEQMEYFVGQHQKDGSGNDVLRGIGRMMNEIMPDDSRGKLEAASANFLKNRALGLKALMEDAHFQAHRGYFDRSLEILETFLASEESKNGEMIKYPDDNHNEYHQFENRFEEILFFNIAKPKRKVTRLPSNYLGLYTLYGGILVEVKRLDEAAVALDKAIRINPVSTNPRFERAEILKMRGDWSGFKSSTDSCFEIAYRSSG